MTGRHDELRDRVAIVTGGARGIGFGVARRLGAEGMTVVLADLDASTLDSATGALGRDGVEIIAIQADVSKRDDVDRLFRTVVDRLGTVDLLVNNAADLQRRRVLDEHEALLDLQLSTNIAGPYRCSQRAASVMEAAGGGSIVNISSVGATRAHHRGLPYDVTKGAIDAMTRAMAVDLGPSGIRVNAIAPGMTMTERSRSVTEDRRATTAELIPLRRYGTVHDIGAMVAFLASADAAYVTGQILTVDGGITAQLSPPGPNEF